jgi:hypothetical protein
MPAIAGTDLFGASETLALRGEEEAMGRAKTPARQILNWQHPRGFWRQNLVGLSN